jgi:type IV pilus assembly protein PilM
MFDRRILGLDLGSYAVKAAELRAGLRGVEFIRFEEERLPEQVSPEERAEAVAAFLEDRELSVDLVVAALPADQGTQRHIRFPFSDARRVSQALPFEIGEDLPMPLDDLILTHERVVAHADRTDVLALLAPRERVRAWLETLRLAGAEPRILEAEGAVLANLSKYLHLGDATRLIVDIGHRKTTLCLLVDGKPALMRCVPVAGAHFTDALARDLRLSPEAAEVRKHASGLFEPGSTKPVSDSVNRLLERLVREFARTLQSAARDDFQSAAPSEVLLVGGSSVVPGLDTFLGDQIGRPCRLLRVPPGDEGRSLLSSVGPERFAQAAAMALRAASPTRVTRVDFRKGEFRYVPDLSDLRRGLRPTLALAAVLLALWIASLAVRAADYGRQAEALRDQLVAIHETAFPGVPVPPDTLKAIETRVRETRELASHLGVTGIDLSPLEILREVARQIPGTEGTGLNDLQIEQYTVQARGFAPSFEAVDQIRAELSKVEAFDNVRLSDVVTDPKRGGKTFNLTIRLAEGT